MSDEIGTKDKISDEIGSRDKMADEGLRTRDEIVTRDKKAFSDADVIKALSDGGNILPGRRQQNGRRFRPFVF